MKRLCILLALTLFGCSSGIQTFESNFDSSTEETTSPPDTGHDAGLDSNNEPDTMDATIDLGSVWPDVSWPTDVDASLCAYPDADMLKYYVTNNISLTKSVNVPYNAAEAGVTDSGYYGSGIDVFGVVSDTITNGTLPYDPNGLYFLLPSTEVPVLGFCYSFCGYHESGMVPLGDGGMGLVRYSVVPDFSTCPMGCNPWSVSGVTNADGMASVMAHELAEAASDPDPLAVTGDPSALVAWRDVWGYEIGDKCAWTFGNVYIGSKDAGSSIYNIEFGSRHWLIQQMWSLSSPGGLTDHCVLDMHGNPGFNVDAAGFPTLLEGGFTENEVFNMEYFGGRVLTGPINIYYIYYGAWADTDTAYTKDVLATFANNIGASDWWQIVTPYYWEPACKGGDGGLVDAGMDTGTDAINEASSQ